MQEIDILNWIYDTFRCTFLDWMSLAFDYAFKTCIIWVILGIILLRRPNTRMFGVVLLCSLALEIIFVYSFKYGFMRHRPFEDYAVHALVNSFHTSSFPSGHTAQLFCVATVFAVFCKKHFPEILCLAFLVAFTRMYMYAHYPTDVLAGAVVGIGCSLVAIFTILRMDEYVYYVKDPDQD